MTVINIIVRITDRTLDQFDQCYQSILKISNTKITININVISDDDQLTDQLDSKYSDLVIFPVDRIEKKGKIHIPEYAYLNEILHFSDEAGDLFKQGWIMFVDDGYQLNDLQPLIDSIESTKDTGRLYLWKTQVQDQQKPGPKLFGMPPKKGEHHLSGFLVHHSHKKLIKFDTKKDSDFHVLSKLYCQLDPVWIDQILVTKQTKIKLHTKNPTTKPVPVSAPDTSVSSRLDLSSPKPSVPNISPIAPKSYSEIKPILKEIVHNQQTLSNRIEQMEQKIIKLIKNIPQAPPVPLVPPVQQAPPAQTQSSSIRDPQPQAQTQPQTAFNYLFMITDQKHHLNLQRNHHLLTQQKIDHEIIYSRNSNLYHYQRKLKDIIVMAQSKQYSSIAIVHGLDLINNKFTLLLNQQWQWIKSHSQGALLSLWFWGLNQPRSIKKILQTDFDHDHYLLMYNDVVQANKRKPKDTQRHWKMYGHKEGRFARILAQNKPKQPIDNHYGLVIFSNMYDPLISLIDQQKPNSCQNVLILLQEQLLKNYSESIWVSIPDLVIPKFSSQNEKKNRSKCITNGWYYNFYLED